MKLYELKYGDKTIRLEPYNTSAEKSLLMGTELFNVGLLDEAIKTLSNYIDYNKLDELTDNEKKLILLKLRAISVGEEIPIKFICDNCNKPIESVLNISNIHKNGKKSDKVKDIYEDLTEDNFHKFVDTNVDELELDEYDKLYELVEESIVKFNFNLPCMCSLCGNKQYFDISDSKYIIDNMSEDTLMSLYKTYNDLIFFSHYTKQDVDSMLPFERSIFIGLLNTTKEELEQ